MNTLFSSHGLKFTVPLHRCHAVLLSLAYMRFDLFRFTFTAFTILVSFATDRGKKDPVERNFWNGDWTAAVS